MQLPSWVKISKPTVEQVKHDVYLVIVAFIGSAFTAWQVQPDKFSKAAGIAAVTAGVAAVITIVKSIFTTL